MEHVGVTIRKAELTARDLEQLLTVFRSSTDRFYPLKFGGVTRWDLSDEDFQNNLALERGRILFKQICSHIGTFTELNPVYQEKYSVMFYPKGSSGVKPHRDSQHSVNCIVIFVVSGNSSFFASPDKDCKDPVEFKTSPGDAIVMRGPRSTADTLPRPIHYVDAVPEPRFVMICRHVNLEGLHQ